MGFLKENSLSYEITLGFYVHYLSETVEYKLSVGNVIFSFVQNWCDNSIQSQSHYSSSVLQDKRKCNKYFNFKNRLLSELWVETLRK